MNWMMEELLEAQRTWDSWPREKRETMLRILLSGCSNSTRETRLKLFRKEKPHEA